MPAHDLFGRLREYWRRHGAVALEGASAADVALFEGRYGVKCPEDFRAYWLAMNGMDLFGKHPRPATGERNFGDQDDQGFSFWPLEQVYRLSEGRPPKEEPIKFRGSDEYFVFADYMQWSWAYAIRLLPTISPANEVVIIGARSAPSLRVAANFEEFVRLYLDDYRRLFPPP